LSQISPASASAWWNSSSIRSASGAVVTTEAIIGRGKSTVQNRGSNRWIQSPCCPSRLLASQNAIAVLRPGGGSVVLFTRRREDEAPCGEAALNIQTLPRAVRSPDESGFAASSTSSRLRVFARKTLTPAPRETPSNLAQGPPHRTRHLPRRAPQHRRRLGPLRRRDLDRHPHLAPRRRHRRLDPPGRGRHEQLWPPLADPVGRPRRNRPAGRPPGQAKQRRQPGRQQRAKPAPAARRLAEKP